MNKFFNNKKNCHWGLGIGDWGLGIGDWAQSPIPNPQSPIPNPQSPIPHPQMKNLKVLIIKLIITFKNLVKINKK